MIGSAAFYSILDVIVMHYCNVLLKLFCCLLCRGLHEELTNRKKLENFLKQSIEQWATSAWTMKHEVRTLVVYCTVYSILYNAECCFSISTIQSIAN